MALKTRCDAKGWIAFEMTTRSNHEAANARKWSARAETYDKKRFDYFRWMQKRAIEVADISAGVRLLDVGCGTGFAVRFCAKRLDDRGLFCGVDVAPRMIELARSSSGELKNVRFEVATAENLPYADDHFDVIICTNSFHHYQNPSVALSEMHRVLCSGGRVVIMDVTADSFLVKAVDRRVRKRESEHVKFYSSPEYRGMFEQASLTYLRTKTVMPPMKVHIAMK